MTKSTETKSTGTTETGTLDTAAVLHRAHAIRARFTRNDTARGDIVWDAATLFGEATAAGLLRVGKGKSDAPLNGKTFGEAIGKSAAYVNLIGRISAAQTLGVAKGSPLHRWLVQNGTSKVVGDYLATDDATLAGLEKIMADKSSTVAPVTAPAVTPVPEQTAAEKSAETGPAMPRNNSGRLDMIETLVAGLTPLTGAEAARLADILAAMESLTVQSAESVADAA